MPDSNSLGGSRMFRLIAVTLAVLFVVLKTYGAPERRVEHQRAEGASPAFSISEFFGFGADEVATIERTSEISDTDAIRMAMQASASARAEQDAAPLRGAVLAASLTTTEDAQDIRAETANFWYVTGTTVNLRQGPGTSNPVVGSVSLGTEAEVLSNQDGWYQIRTADGSAAGWIFGQFLTDQNPG